MSDSDKITKYEKVKSVLAQNGLEVYNWGKFTVRKQGDTANADFIFETIDELYGFMCGFVNAKYGTQSRDMS